jgi:hypothetical protein
MARFVKVTNEDIYIKSFSEEQENVNTKTKEVRFNLYML